MAPSIRKFALVAHVASSVGWMGAVSVLLAIAIIGLRSADPTTVRGAYLLMEPLGRGVLVPLALVSLLSGIVQSLGTPWGLFRHYWVVIKLGITVLATVILVIYLETFESMAAAAMNSAADLEVLRNASPAVHAALALVALLTATVLAVFKPRGLTRYGWRKQLERQRLTEGASP